MTLNEIKAALRAAGIDNFSGEAHILIKEFFKTDAPDPNADFDCPALKDARAAAHGAGTTSIYSRKMGIL